MSGCFSHNFLSVGFYYKRFIIPGVNKKYGYRHFNFIMFREVGKGFVEKSSFTGRLVSSNN